VVRKDVGTKRPVTNKKGRNFQIGIPLSSDLWRISIFQELGKDYISARRSMAPKKLNHFQTVPKCTFQDHI